MQQGVPLLEKLLDMGEAEIQLYMVWGNKKVATHLESLQSQGGRLTLSRRAIESAS